MNLAELYLLKDFLDTISLEDKEELLSFLDVDTQEVFAEIHALPFNPSKGLESYHERLSHIHPSWFVSLIKEYSDADKYSLVAALPPQMQPLLLEHFHLSRTDQTITEFAKDFICERLYLALTHDTKDLLPKEALPLDPLNVLLNISRSQLLEVIDLLSLHDLNSELKSLISAQKLKKLYQLLTLSQKNYLAQIQKKNELLSFKPLGLCYWDGETDLLKKALHQRGLNRLAKALFNSCNSLQWYICHKLDISRATSVQTLMKDMKNKAAHAHLIDQIQNATAKIL
jgi:hypothetical protein